jgi:hypothetical protein
VTIALIDSYFVKGMAVADMGAVGRHTIELLSRCDASTLFEFRAEESGYRRTQIRRRTDNWHFR